ncbi:NAD(P)H-dependent flavin oxidoreductase [Halopelagius fulvigenes]|uniref:NAD(P)H-dependent flavin oxidoreductase n=1 Tax=Halopelagius fulvigenes TaxID=1198324 RepID=A0ABD5TTU2_9EURY
MDTRLTERLGIERPVVQAPVGSATCPELAAAVSEAGGLGMLAVTWRDPDDAREAVRETTRRTDAPVGVNVVLDPDASDVPASDHVEACLDVGIGIFSFSFGDAAPFVDRIRDEGGTVLQTVGSAEEARTAVDAGVNVVVAQGWEAGGHVQSDVATMPLIPRVADAVDVPVVAAGGISDGRGLAAALTLGADGAWLGTRFLAAEEARVHRAYRRRVVEADETETVYGTPYPDGWPGVPHRVIRNETTDRWREAGEPERGRPGEGETVARSPDGEPLSRYEDSLAVPGTDGDVTELPLYAGQSVGLTREVAPAATIVETLVEDARTALGSARSSLPDAE